MLTMVDLFCGINGASMSMRERVDRWRVIGIDREHVNKRENFSRRAVRNPEIIADVRALPFADNMHVDFLWASPPCTYYSRYDKKCWYPNEPEPSHELYMHARAAIDDLKPKYWAIENVRGAQRFWGKATAHFGPVYVWTNIPGLTSKMLYIGKQFMSSRESYLRSETPMEVSTTFADAVERLLA
jgi:site-specific DNA-cytosine methylase